MSNLINNQEKISTQQSTLIATAKPTQLVDRMIQPEDIFECQNVASNKFGYNLNANEKKEYASRKGNSNNNRTKKNPKMWSHKVAHLIHFADAQWKSHIIIVISRPYLVVSKFIEYFITRFSSIEVLAFDENATKNTEGNNKRGLKEKTKEKNVYKSLDSLCVSLPFWLFCQLCICVFLLRIQSLFAA